MKMKIFAVSLVAVGAMFFASDAYAFGVKAAQSLYLSADQTIEGSYFAAGQNVTIDGTVTGDLFCAGQNVIINGKILGDILCAGQAVTINGEISGDARLVGNVVIINSRVGKNLMIFAASAVLSSRSDVGGDALVGAAGVEARGKVSGELYGGGAGVVIDGPVGKNVSMDISCNSGKKGKQCGNLSVGKNAIIGGNLSYRAAPEVTFLNEGTVSGTVQRLEPKAKMKPAAAQINATIIGLWFLSRLLAIISALVIALILVALFGERLTKLSMKMFEKKGASFGWGVALVIIAPIACIFALITVIGIPLAAAGAFIWLAAMIIAKVTGAIAIGEKLFGKLRKEGKNRSMYLVALLGVVVCYLIFSIPVLGSILAFVVMLWSLGGLWIHFRDILKEKV